MEIPEDFKIVDVENKGKGVVSGKDYKKGEIIANLEWDFIKKRDDASDMSVQIGEDKFLDSKEVVWNDLMNHSCVPNMRIDFDKMVWIALRDIEKEEELTWNYFTSEYEMEDFLWFDCKCGEENCLGEIKGFRFLTREEQLELKPFLSKFLKGKLESSNHPLLVK